MEFKFTFNSYYVSYTDSNISPYLNFSADGQVNKGDTISASVIKYTNYNHNNTAYSPIWFLSDFSDTLY